MELQIKINANSTIKIEADDAKDLIKLGAFWQELPSECPECKAPLTLSFRAPKNFEYFGLRCKGKVQHETNFGQYKNEWKEAWTEEK